MPAPKTIVGVWGQPISKMAYWKALGINTMVGADLEGGKTTQPQWEQACSDHGMCFVTLPMNERIAEQAAQPYRLAFMQGDEPDLNRWKANEPETSPNNSTLIPSGSYKGWRKPEILRDVYNRCKAAAPNMPVFCNFAGPVVTGQYYTHGDGHDPYIAASDYLCGDWHVLNMDAVRYGPQQVKDMLRRLALWSANPASIVANGVTDVTNIAKTVGSKLRTNYVECSDQGLSNANGRGPTPAEFEEQVRLTMQAGCSGYILFAHSFNIGWPAGYSGNDRIPGMNERILSLAQEYAGTPPVDPPPVDPPPSTSLEARVAALEAKMAGIAAAAK